MSDKKDSPPAPPEGWNRCRAYMEKKRRFCRHDHLNEFGYCGNHKHLSAQPCKPRVPCPIDPSHLIDEDQMEKHIKICPKVTRQKEQEEKPYFRKDINSGGHGAQGNQAPNDNSLEWAQKIAIRVLEIHQRLFGAEQKSVESLTKQEIHDALVTKDFSKPEMDSGLAHAVEYHRIKSGGPRHIHQQASLLGHLRSAGVIPPFPQGNSNQHSDITFLEMGAGRGMFGLVAAGVAAASGSEHVSLTMVERNGSRSKADTILRKCKEWKPLEYMKLNTVHWSRIQCDLAHVYLPTITVKEDTSNKGRKRKDPDGKGKQLVVVAKHLCGAGTDLALKSLRDVDVDVCIMATCCHGVCNWDDYVARDFLIKEFGSSFGAAEFELLRKWSSGTVATVPTGTLGFDPEHQPVEDNIRDPHGVTVVTRSLNLVCGIQGLGRACQRLLDAGRCDYLRKIIFPAGSHQVDLCHYVDADVTPQNAVILAMRSH